MPPLPPLPPASAWKGIWGRAILRYSMDRTNREFRGRIMITNPKHTDEFVRALRIRPGEVVVEAFPGPGQLTRSLLYGGNDPITADKYPKPSVVVACEPSPQMLQQGLGLREDQMPEIIAAKFESEDYSVYHSSVHQSEAEPRLLLSPSTPYRWPTLPQMLSHPLVTPHLAPSSDSAESKDAVQATKRRWDAPAPAITLVSQMPDSVAGDQMIAQWISSATGELDGQKNWIWQWGRVRLALLVGKNQYDRLMAGPGEKIFCKLSVIARALFHISALPPYHHVYNVDKSSRRTEDEPIYPAGTKPKGGTKAKAAPLPIPPCAHERTVMLPGDFHPLEKGYIGDNLDIPLARPRMLGVLLEPRLDSPIHNGNRDDWDYVLRKCFVTEAQPLRVGLKNLAFGGEGLLDKISSDGTKFKGRPVSGDKMVRDMDVEEWTRVVDVFSRWPFKPENLILDTKPEAFDQRQIGTD